MFGNGLELENYYDGEQLRAGTSVNGQVSHFIYYNGVLQAETDGDWIAENRNVLGYGIAASERKGQGGYHAYHLDEQNSTAYITGNQRDVENFYEYDAFGAIRRQSNEIQNRILYTGQQYDQETGQYYLRARFYNPAVGRFLQEDVYRGDGLNLYAYCANNPVVYYDPSGYNDCKNEDQSDTGSTPAKKANEGSGGTKHKIGENGVKISGSKTVGQNGQTERVDIENPNPGIGDGNMHYHEPDNQKWYYDFDNDNLIDTTGTPAPPKIQKVLKTDWVKKAIKKGKKYLGE